MMRQQTGVREHFSLRQYAFPSRLSRYIYKSVVYPAQEFDDRGQTHANPLKIGSNKLNAGTTVIFSNCPIASNVGLAATRPSAIPLKAALNPFKAGMINGAIVRPNSVPNSLKDVQKSCHAGPSVPSIFLKASSTEAALSARAVSLCRSGIPVMNSMRIWAAFRLLVAFMSSSCTAVRDLFGGPLSWIVVLPFQKPLLLHLLHEMLLHV